MKCNVCGIDRIGRVVAGIVLVGLRADTILDAFAFAGDSRMVAEVWSAGRHVVQSGRHIAREAITESYRRAVRPLRDGL